MVVLITVTITLVLIPATLFGVKFSDRVVLIILTITLVLNLGTLFGVKFDDTNTSVQSYQHSTVLVGLKL